MAAGTFLIRLGGYVRTPCVKSNPATSDAVFQIAISHKVEADLVRRALNPTSALLCFDGHMVVTVDMKYDHQADTRVSEIQNSINLRNLTAKVCGRLSELEESSQATVDVKTLLTEESKKRFDAHVRAISSLSE